MATMIYLHAVGKQIMAEETTGMGAANPNHWVFKAESLGVQRKMVTMGV